jgi:hypothetical protein
MSQYQLAMSRAAEWAVTPAPPEQAAAAGADH